MKKTGTNQVKLNYPRHAESTLFGQHFNDMAKKTISSSLSKKALNVMYWKVKGSIHIMQPMHGNHTSLISSPSKISKELWMPYRKNLSGPGDQPNLMGLR